MDMAYIAPPPRLCTSQVFCATSTPIGNASGKMLRMTHDKSGRHVTRPIWDPQALAAKEHQVLLTLHLHWYSNRTDLVESVMMSEPPTRQPRSDFPYLI